MRGKRSAVPISTRRQRNRFADALIRPRARRAEATPDSHIPPRPDLIRPKVTAKIATIPDITNFFTQKTHPPHHKDSKRQQSSPTDALTTTCRDRKTAVPTHLGAGTTIFLLDRR